MMGGAAAALTPMAPVPDHCICREVVKERYTIVPDRTVIGILCMHDRYCNDDNRAAGVFLRSTHLAAPLNVLTPCLDRYIPLYFPHSPRRLLFYRLQHNDTQNN
jgi:hypothetical protein